MVGLLSKWSLLSVLFYLPVFSSSNSLHENEVVFHPFYVSVTEIDYNAREGSLEISCKMFADDFENTLREQFKTKIDFAQPKDSKQLERMVYQYVQKHLQLKVNGKPASLQFVGFEKENEAAWCYLQVSNVPAVKRLDITNSLLYESYDSQISIMHVSVNGNRQSTRLINPESNTSFTF